MNRIYGIVRKSDKMVIVRSASRKQVFLLFNKRYDKRYYAIAILKK